MKNCRLMLFWGIFLTSAAFAQSYTGFYKAQFISIESNSPKPVVEFEVQANNVVTGKIIIGAGNAIINGQINPNGLLEAKSESIGNIIFTLKSDLKNSDRKITLKSRSEINSPGKQTASQAVMWGNYTKVEKSGSENTQSLLKNESRLFIEQPNPLFEKVFLSLEAKITVEKSPSMNIYHLQMIGGSAHTERGFYFSLARVQDSSQRLWKIEKIRAVNYVEKTENYTKINRFRINYEMWLKNNSIATGEVELLSEDSRQMVFKITNLEIKNEVNNDFVKINGIVKAAIYK